MRNALYLQACKPPAVIVAKISVSWGCKFSAAYDQTCFHITERIILISNNPGKVSAAGKVIYRLLANDWFFIDGHF